MGCSRTTAHKWLKTGTIPYVKVGSIYLYNEIEVLEGLKNRKRRRPNMTTGPIKSQLGNI